MPPSVSAPTLDDLSSTQQDYLEAVYFLSASDGDGVHLVHLAQRLGVKPPSAVDVISRLKEIELVTQEPRDTIKLTASGYVLAQQLATRHETIRHFFTEVLRLPHDVADAEACKVEHALSPESFDRLRDFLEHVNEDSIESDQTTPLTLMNKGEKGVLARTVGGAGRARRLAAMGVRTGEVIEVLQNSRSGPVMIRAGGARLAIGRGLATTLHIRTLPADRE
jgi:DtxR family Mn-dependent transcriptional regulator